MEGNNAQCEFAHQDLWLLSKCVCMVLRLRCEDLTQLGTDPHPAEISFQQWHPAALVGVMKYFHPMLHIRPKKGFKAKCFQEKGMRLISNATEAKLWAAPTQRRSALKVRKFPLERHPSFSTHTHTHGWASRLHHH